MGCIVVVVEEAVEFAVPFGEIVVRVDPSRMSLDCEVEVDELVCVPELLLATMGVPLSPKIVVVPTVRVLVTDSPVIKERISDVVIAVAVDLVIVVA